MMDVSMMASIKMCVLMVVWVSSISSVSLFLLEGSSDSYAQFPPTSILHSLRSNNSLSMEVRSSVADALVLYVDNHNDDEKLRATTSYLELSLVRGSLRARFKWTDARDEHVVTLAETLSDRDWHTVKIERSHEGVTTTFSVDHHNPLVVHDDLESSRTSSTSSYVYVGGLPRWLHDANHPLPLRLPTTLLRRHLRGQVRNLRYASISDNGDRIQQQQMLAFKGVRQGEEVVDVCDVAEEVQGCLNGGHCFIMSGQAMCDCSHTGHSGDRCESQASLQSASSATFVGVQYLWLGPLSSSKWPSLISTQERLRLHFKTRKSAGLIFFAGNEKNEHLSLALKSGALLLRVQIDEKRLERHYEQEQSEGMANTPRLNDNKWHQVVVERTIEQVSVTVDGVFHERWLASSSESESESESSMTKSSGLEVTTLFVGGSEATFDGTKHEHNFIGCLRNVLYESDGLYLDLLSMGERGNPLIRSTANIEYVCRDIKPGDPLAFTKSLSSWSSSKSSLSSGVISMAVENAFLLLPSWPIDSSGSLRLSFRTTESQGLLLFNSGRDLTTSPTKSKEMTNHDDDYFALELIDGHLYLHIHQSGHTLKLRASRLPLDDGHWHRIEVALRGKLGRVGVDEVSESFELHENIDNDKFNLEGKMFLGGVDYADSNLKLPPQLWTAALRRGFVGCIRNLVVNGAPVDLVAKAHQQDVGAIRSSCHEMALQCHDQPCLHGGECVEGWNRYTCDCTQTAFAGAVCGHRAATYEFKGGEWLRLSLSSAQTSESEDLSLRFRTSSPSALLLETTHHRSQDKLELALDAGRVRLRLKMDHVVDKVVHVGESLNDNVYHTIRYERRGTRVRVRIDDSQLDEAIVTELFSTSHHLSDRNQRRSGLQLSISHLSVGGSSLDDYALTSSSSFPNLKGYLQHLVLNNQHLFQVAADKLWMPNQLQSTAKLIESSKDDEGSDNQQYAAVHLKASNSFLGLPQLKAYNQLGLRFRFRTFEKNGLLLFNGGKARDYIAVEMVDAKLVYTINLGYGPITLTNAGLVNQTNLADNTWHLVVIGRVNRHRHVLVVDGHEVHVDSRGDNHHLDLDGILYLGGLREESYSSLPRPLSSRVGFQGCIAGMEANGELIDPIRHALVTSQNIEEGCREAVAFEFGVSGGGGVVRYFFDSSKRPDTSKDELSLGFISANFDAVILRVDSFPDLNRDFLQVLMVAGKLRVEYNLGAKDVVLTDYSSKINDGKYHVLRFHRSGANSSLQIDDKESVSVNPVGNRHLTVFNDQAMVQIGGLYNDGVVENAFVGVIAGVNFNGLRPLELARAKESNLEEQNIVARVGDATLLPAGIPFDFRERHAHLFSDEAMKMRMQQAEQHRQHQQRQTQGALPEMSQCDDEDDCVDGSGSGQFDVNVDDDTNDADFGYEQRQQQRQRQAEDEGEGQSEDVSSRGHKRLISVTLMAPMALFGLLT